MHVKIPVHYPSGVELGLAPYLKIRQKACHQPNRDRRPLRQPTRLGESCKCLAHRERLGQAGV